MNLRESLHQEVADVHADHDALLRAARDRGRVVQRRRKVLRDTGAVLASAAVVAAVLVGVSTTTRSDETGPEGREAASPTATASQDPVETTVPVTGRTAAAVLLEVLADLDQRGVLVAVVADDSISGSPDDDGTAGEQAYVRLLVATGTEESQLGINVQRWSSLGLEGGCGGARQECRTSTLADGDQLTTYRPDDGKSQRQLSAEVVSTDRDLRVLVDATETSSGSEPITREQLAAIARASQWGLQLPGRYAAAAADLPSYDAE